MLIKKQTEKDHTELRAGCLNAPKDAAAALGTYSDEISCSPLEAHALQVGTFKPSVSNWFLMLLQRGDADVLKSKKCAQSVEDHIIRQQWDVVGLTCESVLSCVVAVLLTSWAWRALVRNSEKSWSTSAGCLPISWLGGKQSRCLISIWSTNACTHTQQTQQNNIRKQLFTSVGGMQVCMKAKWSNHICWPICTTLYNQSAIVAVIIWVWPRARSGSGCDEHGHERTRMTVSPLERRILHLKKKKKHESSSILLQCKY